MNLDHVPWHDARILKLTEEPESDLVTLEVKYCLGELGEGALSEEWGLGRIRFRDCECYSVVEGPNIGGKCFILSARVVRQAGRLSLVRLETTAGHREFLCEAVEFVAGAG